MPRLFKYVAGRACHVNCHHFSDSKFDNGAHSSDQREYCRQKIPQGLEREMLTKIEIDSDHYQYNDIMQYLADFYHHWISWTPSGP